MESVGKPNRNPLCGRFPRIRTTRIFRKTPKIGVIIGSISRFPSFIKFCRKNPLVASHAAVPSKPGAAGGNISPTGACLVLAEKLARGTVLALSLHGLEGGSVSAVGKVVWSKPTETAHHYLTGLEFVVVYRKTRSKTEYLNTDILKSLLGPS
jgi:hypothetical protein